MVKKIIFYLGIFFLVIGIGGFIPGLTRDGHLLGIFEVDTLHNIIHLFSGVLAVSFVYLGERWAKMFGEMFSFIYGIITIFGVFIAPALASIQLNAADNVLHLGITGVCLYAGFRAPH